VARKRYTEEDVLNRLRQMELGLASSRSVVTAYRSVGVSDYAHFINYFETDHPNISIITVY